MSEERHERQEIRIPQSVVDAVLAFANGYTYEEKRRVVLERPGELLGEYADLMLQVLIAQYEDQPDSVHSLAEDRELLAECRELGVDEAFARRIRPSRSELTTDLTDRLRELADEEDIMRFLARRPGVRRLLLEAVQALVSADGAPGKAAVLTREAGLLLTPAAEYVLRVANDETYAAHADLVAVARQYGIGPAMEWMGAEVEPLEGTEAEQEIALLLQELAYADRRMTPVRKAELCRRGRELAEPGSPEWAGFTSLLGDALLEMYGEDRADLLEEAIGCFTAIGEYGQVTGRPVVVAKSHERLAHTYTERVRGDRTANLERAVEEADLALATLPEDADRETTLMVNYTAALAYQERPDGDHAENLRRAHGHAITALALAPESSIRSAELGIEQVLALIARTGGPDDDNDLGLRRITRVRDQIDPLEDPDNYAAVQMTVAETLMATSSPGRPEQAERAIEALHAALAYTDPIGRRESWARIQERLADAYRWRVAGDFGENMELAVEHARQALTVFTKEGYPDQWAAAFGQLADAIRLRPSGNPLLNAREARRLYDELAAFYEAALDDGAASSDGAGSRVQWAHVQRKLGHLHRAALAEPGVDHEALALDGYRRALEVYEEEGRDEDAALVHANLFDMVRPSGPEDEALAHAESALAGLDPEHSAEQWAGVHLGLGELHAGRRRFGLAREHLARALDPAVPTSRRHQASALIALADVDAGEGHPDAALAGYLAAAEHLEALFADQASEAGQEEVLPRLNHAYTHAAYVSLLAGRVDEALRLADLGSARVLGAAFDLAAFQPGPDVPEWIAARVRRARERVEDVRAELNARSDDGRDSAAALLRELAAARAELASAVAEASSSVPAPDDLPDTVTTVVPVITSFGSALVVLPGKELVRLDALTSGEVGGRLSELLIAYLAVSSGAPLGELSALMEELVGWLWDSAAGPLRRRLEELGVRPGTRLRFAASELSGLLALHAARPREGGPTLLDEYVISYTPSLRVSRELRRRAADSARSSGSILLLADSLRDLPFAAQEAAAISALFPAEGRMVLAGPSVTAEAVEAYAPGRGYLHFACHAFVNWVLAGHSGIWMADRDVLVAGRVAAFDLSAARLVVLSACESGVTAITGSTGEYTGLAAAFLRAGAPGVIASLWNVSDQATSLLMRRLYAELLAGATPAEALRIAQLWLRDATVSELAALEPATARTWRLLGYGPDVHPYVSPYFWAGFTLMGE